MNKLLLYITDLILKFGLILAFMLGGTGLVCGQLVNDNFGGTASNPLSRTGWTEDSPSTTSNWEIVTNTPNSSGYSGASGSACVYTTMSGSSITKTLTYDNNLSTIGYTGLTLTFGGYKSSTNTVPNLIISYSTDGTIYNSFTGNSVSLTTSWTLYTVNLPSDAENKGNLRIRFSIITNNQTRSIRIDDFKLTGTPCSAPSITCPSSISSFLNPAAGLINAYPINETSGAVANDVMGNKDGTFVNSPSWNTQGKYNGAVLFDGGTATTSDYIDLPDGIVSGLSSDYTISTWVYMNSNSGSYSYVRIFDFGNSSTTGYVYLCPRTGTNGGVQFSISQTTYTAEQSLSYATPLSLATWHHIVVTVQGNTGRMYIDGTSVVTNTGMTLKPSVLGNTANNYFGKSQYSTDGYFSGRIDEFRIYNVALTGAQVTALYTKTSNCEVASDLGNGGLGSPTVTGGCGTVTVANNAPSPLPAGLNTITWTATDGALNTSSCTQSVTVVPSLIAFNGILSDQCASNTSYSLSGGTPSGGTYSGPGVSGNVFNASIAGVGTHTITYAYTFIYADGSSCPETATNTIKVNALPSFTAGINSNITCNGLSNGEINLHITSSDTSPFTFSTNNGTNYAQTFTGEYPNYILTGLQAGTYPIRVKDANQCESTINP